MYIVYLLGILIYLIIYSRIKCQLNINRVDKNVSNFNISKNNNY